MKIESVLFILASIFIYIDEVAKDTYNLNFTKNCNRKNILVFVHYNENGNLSKTTFVDDGGDTRSKKYEEPDLEKPFKKYQ